MKKNLIISVILVLSTITLSSCGTMSSLGYYALGTPQYMGVPIASSRNEGPEADAAANRMGVWQNANTTIRLTNEKNVYQIHHHNGKITQEYLKPLKALLVNMPAGCTMYGIPRPYWDTYYETLCWRVQTYGQQKTVLLYSSGSARGI